MFEAITAHLESEIDSEHVLVSEWLGDDLLIRLMDQVTAHERVDLQLLLDVSHAYDIPICKVTESLPAMIYKLGKLPVEGCRYGY